VCGVLLIPCGVFSGCAGTASGPEPHYLTGDSPETPTDSTWLPHIPLWTYKGKTYFGGPPIAIESHLVLPNRKGRLVYLDPNSGKEVREAKAKYSLEHRPLRYDDRLFVTTSAPKHTLQALRAHDGKRLWRRDFRRAVQQPIIVGEELWLPVGDTVYAVSPDDGTVLRSVCSGGDIWLSPVAAADQVALVGRSGVIRCFSTSDSLLWNGVLSGSFAEPPVWLGPSLVVATAEGMVAKFGPAGKTVWSDTLDREYLYLSVDAGHLYVVGRSGRLWALSGDSGRVLWERDLGVPGAGPALIRDAWLAVTTVDGRLWFLDRTSGEVRDSVTFEALIHHAPVWAFGRLYVVTADKRVYAFGMGP